MRIRISEVLHKRIQKSNSNLRKCNSLLLMLLDFVVRPNCLLYLWQIYLSYFFNSHLREMYTYFKREDMFRMLAISFIFLHIYKKILMLKGKTYYWNKISARTMPCKQDISTNYHLSDSNKCWILCALHGMQFTSMIAFLSITASQMVSL